MGVWVWVGKWERWSGVCVCVERGCACDVVGGAMGEEEEKEDCGVLKWGEDFD